MLPHFREHTTTDSFNSDSFSGERMSVAAWTVQRRTISNVLAAALSAYNMVTQELNRALNCIQADGTS